MTDEAIVWTVAGVLIVAGVSFHIGWYLGRVHLMLDDMIKREENQDK
jgi:membrane protein DedA with SNARE-associated domain